MTEKDVVTLKQRLIELNKIAGEYEKQIRLAMIASHHGDEPDQVILNHLSNALEMLNQSIPKILIAKHLLTGEN